jgi:hypothetical protein
MPRKTDGTARTGSGCGRPTRAAIAVKAENLMCSGHSVAGEDADRPAVAVVGVVITCRDRCAARKQSILFA